MNDHKSRGSYVHKPIVKFSGASLKIKKIKKNLLIFQNIDGFRQTTHVKAFRIHKTKQNPLQNVFFLFSPFTKIIPWLYSLVKF